MSQFNFGIGNIYATPAGGGTPIVFGTISGASIEDSGDVKMLYGQNQYPDAVATGKRKLTGKLTFGRINLAAFAQIYYGGTSSTGQLLLAAAEAHSVAASSPYTVTATNAANFSTDLGVYYASTGVQLVQVTSSPTSGQYSVAAGVYTFATGDSGKAVVINYSYTSASTGSTLPVNQSLMGTTPNFSLLLLNPTTFGTQGIYLYNCVADKLNTPFKQDDFTEIEVDFSAFANSLGQVMTRYSS